MGDNLESPVSNEAPTISVEVPPPPRSKSSATTHVSGSASHHLSGFAAHHPSGSASHHPSGSGSHHPLGSASHHLGSRPKSPSQQGTRSTTTSTGNAFGLTLPLHGSRESSRNQFNLAKARADAAAAAAFAAASGMPGHGSAGSTYRRQSGSSQISYTSTTRSVGGRPTKRRTKKIGDVLTAENVQVYDDHGKDVTPKPLVSLKPTVRGDKGSQATGLSDRPTPAYISTDTSIQPYSRTGYSITSSAGSLTPETVEGEEADRDDGGSISVKSRSVLGTSIGVPEIPKIIQIVMAPIPLTISEKDKEKTISVYLHESESMMLLHFRGTNFNAAYEGVAKILERNEKYEALLQLKQGSDNYNHAHAQTLVLLLKNKEVQAFASSMQSEAIQATTWDIYDSITGQKQSQMTDPWTIAQGRRQAEQAAAEAALVPSTLPKLYGYDEGPNAPRKSSPLNSPDASRRPSTLGETSRRGSTSGQGSRRPSISGKVSRRGSKDSGQASRRVSTTTSVKVKELFGGKLPGVAGGSIATGEAPQGPGSDGTATTKRVFDGDISKLANLGKAIQVAERALVQNSYHDKFLAYKDYRPRDPPPEPDTPEEVEEEEPLPVRSPTSPGGTTTSPASPSPSPDPPPAEDEEVPHTEDSNAEKSSPRKDVPPPPPPPPPPPSPPIPNPNPPWPDDEEGGEAAGPQSPTDSSSQVLNWLWDYKCELTDGKNISCMCWNKVNKDLLTVGYGEFDFGAQKGGMVAFWSIKNPGYPIATITCKSDVTSIDFSIATPTLLAVGFYNGVLAIYDTRNPKDMQPIVQSGMTTGRHEDPIWKVQWIDSNSEHGESLVSISTDGRVSQWFLKKDLEFVNLIKLKRISVSKGEQAQPFISRRSAGMCFDFCPRDPGMYLVGSEEGLIYKCDRSYSEQYMSTYVGHTGPVYQVRWNLTVSNYFLSCSSDWTVRFWREEQETALMVIQTNNVGVSDVQWSMKNSTVFATVSVDGRLEIYDMAISVLKPTVVFKAENSKLSCLMFAEEAPVVLTGGSNGVVTVLRLDGFEKVESEQKQVKLFKDALAFNVNAHLG